MPKSKEETTNERAVMGGNQPPIEEQMNLLAAELVAKVEPIAKRANALPKKIATELDLSLVTPVVVDAKALSKSLEAMRKEQKDPFLKASKSVDGFFNPLKERMDKISSVFERLAGDFQREKIAAERRRAEAETRRKEAEAAKLREQAEEVTKEETKQRRLDDAADAENAANRAAAAATKSAAELGRVTSEGGTARVQTFWNFSIDDYNEVDLNSMRDFIDRAAIEKAIRAKIKIQKGNTQIKGVKVFEDVRSSIR